MRHFNRFMMTKKQTGHLAAVADWAIGDALSGKMTAAKNHREPRLCEAFEHGPIGVAVLCNDLLMVEVNAAFCALLGYRETDLLLMSFADLLHPDDVETCRRVAWTLDSGDPAVTSIGCRCLTAAGYTVQVQLSLTGAAIGYSGRPTRYIAQLDVDSERCAEAATGSG